MHVRLGAGTAWSICRPVHGKIYRKTLLLWLDEELQAATKSELSALYLMCRTFVVTNSETSGLVKECYYIFPKPWHMVDPEALNNPTRDAIYHLLHTGFKFCGSQQEDEEKVYLSNVYGSTLTSDERVEYRTLLAPFYPLNNHWSLPWLEAGLRKLSLDIQSMDPPRL